LHPFGIKGAALRAKLVLTGSPSWWAAAYVDDDRHIYVCRAWARRCRADREENVVETTLRHELTHLICNRRHDVRRRFRLPDYGGASLVWNQIRCALGFIPYAWIHPEEGLAERVSSLHARTVRALAKALQM